MLQIYICACKDKQYLKEAKICIDSLRKNGQFHGLIYLLTDIPQFLEKLDFDLNNVEVIKVKCGSNKMSAVLRTRFFHYIENYDTNDIFLYLDTDIVVVKPLPSFNSIDNKIQVYGYNSVTQKSNSFSGNITKDTYFTSKPGICSGILLFRPSLKVKNVFDETYELYRKLLAEDKVLGCWEQPALCYKLIEHDMYNISLNNYVVEKRGGEHSFDKKPDTHIFVHFCGRRGPKRVGMMNEYL